MIMTIPILILIIANYTILIIQQWCVPLPVGTFRNRPKNLTI